MYQVSTPRYYLIGIRPRSVNRYSLRKCLYILLLCSGLTGCGSAVKDDTPFDVHFITLTENPEAQVELDQLRGEVDILNRYFRSKNGSSLPRFRFKGAVYARDVRDTSCKDLVNLGGAAEAYRGSRWSRLINECHDDRFRDPGAINFYIYDSWSEKHGFDDTVSHGRFNDGNPYVLIDWERLGHTDQSPEEHEMGHAFGLKHICVEGAKRYSDTNIMASAECGKGSGGKRNVGFDASQVDRIWKSANAIRKNFKPN